MLNSDIQKLTLSIETLECEYGEHLNTISTLESIYENVSARGVCYADVVRINAIDQSILGENFTPGMFTQSPSQSNIVPTTEGLLSSIAKGLSNVVVFALKLSTKIIMAVLGLVLALFGFTDPPKGGSGGGGGSYNAVHRQQERVISNIDAINKLLETHRKLSADSDKSISKTEAQDMILARFIDKPLLAANLILNDKGLSKAAASVAASLIEICKLYTDNVLIDSLVTCAKADEKYAEACTDLLKNGIVSNDAIAKQAVINGETCTDAYVVATNAVTVTLKAAHIGLSHSDYYKPLLTKLTPFLEYNSNNIGNKSTLINKQVGETLREAKIDKDTAISIGKLLNADLDKFPTMWKDAITELSTVDKAISGIDINGIEKEMGKVTDLSAKYSDKLRELGTKLNQDATYKKMVALRDVSIEPSDLLSEANPLGTPGVIGITNSIKRIGKLNSNLSACVISVIEPYGVLTKDLDKISGAVKGYLEDRIKALT